MQSAQSSARAAAEAIAPMWAAACAHAGFVADEEVVLYAFPGPARSNGPWGTYAEPGSGLADIASEHYPFTAADIQDSEACKDLHQIAIRTGASHLEIAGVIRHELEHAAQKHYEPEAAYASGVLSEAFKELGIDAWLGVYPALPAERGANAAAGDFIQRFIGLPTASVLAGVHHLLVEPVDDPPCRGELGIRTLGVAALIPVTFARAVPDPPEGWDLSRTLRALVACIAGEEAPLKWQNLVESAERDVLFRRFRAAVDLAERMSLPRKWTPVRAVLVESERLALRWLR